MAGSYAIVRDLNVRFCGTKRAIHFNVAPVGQLRVSISGRLNNFFVLTGIRTKQEMTLTHVFSISSCVKFALSGLAEVMRSEFTIVTSLIVDFCSAEIIMWLAHHCHSVLLSHQLILMYLRQTRIRICILEESIVMIRCRAVIGLPLEAHFEVCNSHDLRIAHLGLLFQGKFFGRVCLPSRCSV